MILPIIAEILGIAAGLSIITAYFRLKEKKTKKAHEEKMKEIEKTYYETTRKLIQAHDRHITEVAETSWSDGMDYGIMQQGRYGS
jgi:hypothetical protein